MKVLHLISSAGLYGAEAVILTLLAEMRRREEACALGVFLNEAQPNVALHEAALKAGFESYLLPCKGQVDSHAVKGLRRLISRTGADILHTHGYKADVYGYFALRRATVPLVATCHNWCDTDMATRLYGTLDRICLRRFAAVAAVSADVKKRLVDAGLKPSNVPVVHNGIDSAPFTKMRDMDARSPQRSGSYTVGFAGRLSSEKGIDLFLQAAEGISKAIPDVRFLIAGDGPERGAVEHALRDRRLADQVTLLGRCDNMPGFYASLDVLLSASRTEGLPVALMEAMASGIPVVATAVGDVPLLLNDGQAGVLVPCADVPAMQAAVILLLRDPERRKTLAEDGRLRIERNFSAGRMAESYLAVYRKILEARAAPRPGGAR